MHLISHHLISESLEGEKMAMEKRPVNVWGDMPEDEYYASQGLTCTSAFFPTPHGNIFTRSFLPSSSSSTTTTTAADPQQIKGIIFLNHGYNAHSGWLLQLTAIQFARWGYAVYAADFPGHGKSDGLRCYVSDIYNQIDAPLSFFRSVRNLETYEGKPAFLYGESMGAAVVLLMHLKYPKEEWDGAILVASPVVVSKAAAASWTHYTFCRMLLGLADTWPIPTADPTAPRLLCRDTEREVLRACDPFEYLGTMCVGSHREMMWARSYIRKNMDKITIPFLALHGAGDVLTLAEGSQMLVDKAKSKDKMMKLYEGAYHVLLEGEPEEMRKNVMGDIRTWLDGHLHTNFKE